MTSINNFIISFFTSNNVNQEMIEKWNSEENQQAFNNISKTKTRETKTRKTNTNTKRAKSPYIFFCIENRPVIKQNNPEMKPKEIVAEMGRIWREIDKESQQYKKYVKLSEQDKQQINVHPLEEKEEEKEEEELEEEKPKKSIKKSIKKSSKK